MLRLYRTARGVRVETADGLHDLGSAEWDDVINRPALEGWLRERIAHERPEPVSALNTGVELLPPIGRQEVWAAGVTYFRSRTARMEESEAAGGGTFYDRVYEAERPELFMKAAPWRVVGHGGEVRVRRDSSWSVPEPELALVVNSSGDIVGYTIGNDVSARDIEGENPLYLPQAKTYDGACALGPGVLVSSEPIRGDTEIRLEVLRDGRTTFAESITCDQMKRTPQELVDYLYRETSFPYGCILFTGTGIIPPDEWSLRSGDEVRISIEPIGTLVNRVA